jgi:hypothetical protein
MQASAVKVIGWIEDPDTYLDPAEAAHLGKGDPSVLRRARVFLGQ